ncbi:hypothetical protein QYF36_022255 [Acer negundo]|nr:hypothetical protein QYF36_022255 [Acer negundo]
MGLMGKWVGWVILVVGLGTRLEASTHEGRKGYELPMNCRKLECAPYEVIESKNEFEIRSYGDAMWVSTSPFNSTSYKDATGKGFDILFSYIQGNNNQAAKMNMTAPVLVNILPSKSRGPLSFSNSSSFVVHFYIPKKYQKDPPIPSSPQAHPVKLPQKHNKYLIAAVRRFGGYMDDSNIPTQALALKKSLMGTIYESQVSGEIVPYSVAGYNSPFESENRVNEVMFWFDKN